ncbi:MAG: glycosyltransferase [Cyclobacteriaceae bacterium]
MKAAIESVFDQTYQNIELIVVDDESSDQSSGIIKDTIANEKVKFLSLSSNVGNTKAFNKAYAHASGKYIIDLAADDILLKNRIEKQVEFFEKSTDQIGVIYSDAEYIDVEGMHISYHFDSSKYDPHTGDIYLKLIDTYFVPPPTMMIKKEVLDELGGYDEKLAYEDFDFWIRSSRKWHYDYQPEVLTQIRKIKGSLSTQAYSKSDRQFESTYMVCEKIIALNENEEENQALLRRLKYEIIHGFTSGNFKQTQAYISLYLQLSRLPFSLKILKELNDMQINLSPLRRAYYKLVG